MASDLIFQVHLITEDVRREAEQLNRLLDTLTEQQREKAQRIGRIEFASAGATRKR